MNEKLKRKTCIVEVKKLKKRYFLIEISSNKENLETLSPEKLK
jgi:hypothetical protein